MEPRAYCNWIKGAMDLGGDALLRQPEALAIAVKSMPAAGSESSGSQHQEAAFCDWLRGVADACLGMEPPAGLPPTALGQARSRLEAILGSAQPAPAPRRPNLGEVVYRC